MGLQVLPRMRLAADGKILNLPTLRRGFEHKGLPILSGTNPNNCQILPPLYGTDGVNTLVKGCRNWGLIMHLENSSVWREGVSL